MKNRTNIIKNGEMITIWLDQLDIMIQRGWKEENKKESSKKRPKIIEINETTEINHMNESFEITTEDEE